MNAHARAIALAAAILAGFVPLLLVVPTLFDSDPTVFSAAAAEGYNTTAAYRVAMLWTVLGVLGAIAAARAGWLSDAPVAEPEPSGPAISQGRLWIERIFVGLMVVIALWPAFLARHGPYIEDAIFINALHRVHGGMVPYRDFEFLYGPLMLLSASWWMKLVGYSMQQYYTWLAIVEAVQYVLIVVLLQRLIPGARARLIAFLILAALVMNPMLGLNYNGLRRLIPLAGLLLLTRDPTSVKRAAGAGVILGIGIAYAHDFGLVALVAVAGLYGLLWLRTPSVALVRTAALVGAVAVATWLLVAYLLLGANIADYIADTRSLVTRFSAGEAGFRFYWTVNALAGFGAIALAAVFLGRGLARWRGRDLAWGDHFFAVTVIASVLLLKSGLNRSDVWHLDGAFFPLAVAFVLPLPRRALGWSRGEGRVAILLVAIVAFTHAFGNAPSAAYAAQGLARGALDVVTGAGTFAGCPPDVQAPCIESERSEGRAEYVALAEYLAAPERRGRRVLLYGDLWGIGPRIGVYKGDHLNDDFIYDDARGLAAGAWVSEKPDAMVVMTRPAYDRLFAAPGADTVGATSKFRATTVARIGEWLSSGHYRGVRVERPLWELRWRRTAGVAVRRDFVLSEVINPGEDGPPEPGRGLVVLTRRSSP